MRYLTAAVLRELEGKLHGRDWQVVEQVASLRFVSGAQLTRLCFVEDGQPDPKAARYALLRLTRLGVLDRLPRQIGGVRSGSAGFVYHLGHAGYRLAVARHWQPERRRQRSHVPGTLFLRHTLLIAELHTQLVETDRSQSIELLELAGEPACHRFYSGANGQRRSLKPDSYARLGVGDFEDSYFFEIDNGTEGSQTIVRQLGDYIAYHRSGQEQQARGVFPKTLWLTNQPGRIAVIESCVQTLPIGRELFQVAHFEAVISSLTKPENIPPM